MVPNFCAAKESWNWVERECGESDELGELLRAQARCISPERCGSPHGCTSWRRLRR